MFGSWNSKVRQMTVDIGKAEFQFVPRSAGYIKTTADGLPGPPVIVYNHREGITNKVLSMAETIPIPKKQESILRNQLYMQHSMI